MIRHTIINLILSTATLLTLVFILSANVSQTFAAPNYQMNYQGKLLNASNVAVANGTYNMRFWLLTSSTIATTSAIWTESLTGTNRVQVTNGLFSVMLGSTSPLTSVDFNQTLYLGVEVGSTTGSALWDGEMSPRKVLGTVPSAFEAKNANTVGGVASTSLLRKDQADTASGLLTFTGGLISTASSTITNLTTLIATTTTLVVNGESFTDLTGTGLALAGNALTTTLGTDITAGEIANGDHGFFSYSAGTASLDTNGLTSANLISALSDETGSGALVFNNAPTFTGTTNFNALTVTNTSTLGYASTTALTVSGTSYFNFASSSYASTTGLTATNAYLTNATTSSLAITGISGSTQCLQ